MSIHAAIACAVAAATLPSLLAYNVAPSPTFLNQALAFALWPGFVLACAPAFARRGSQPLYVALALLVMAVAASWRLGALPASLALSAGGSLLACAVVVAGGAGVREGDAGPSDRSVDAFAAFCWGWLVAGLLNVAVALVQVFFPDLADGDWIAHSGIAGRAVGNLRQPNHLSSLLLWSCIGVIALHQLGRIGRKFAALAFAGLVFAVVLTASRTGLVSVLLLALWGAFDRRLSRSTRALALAAPLLYALAWLAMAQWAALSQHSFGGAQRLAETDISSSRFAIWRDTLELIRMQPWTGVGFGEFNFAWTLTPLPNRPTALFDHTHNLPLQLAVELGLPLASVVLALLLWSLGRGAKQSLAGEGDLGTAQRSAMVMVLMIGLHSLLEYPLWYSYFLLPTAWAWGFVLARPAPSDERAPQPVAPSRALTVASLAVVACSVFAVLDYSRVTAIFTAADNAPPLEQRIAIGQRSLLFGHHADYAAVTSGVPMADAVHAFDRATHYLLDSRLMIAWARSLAQRGELDAARHVAERLREFKKEDAADFFEACPVASSQAVAGQAFQCALPARAPGWRAFLAHPP